MPRPQRVALCVCVSIAAVYLVLWTHYAHLFSYASAVSAANLERPAGTSLPQGDVFTKIATTPSSGQQGAPAATPMQCTGNWWARCEMPASTMVFALMITGKDALHYRLANLAIKSFVQQTHPSKALVIVNDGSGTPTLPDSSASCICELRVPRKDGIKLGDLRNLAIDQVPRGHVWVQWDDDDWHDPQCMAGQLATMVEKRAAMVFLQRQLQVDIIGNSTFKYEYGEWGIWGTIMGNSSFDAIRGLRLPSTDRGEDLEYDALKSRVPWALWDNPPAMYYRVIHGFNTWDREHFRPNQRGQPGVWCFRVAEEHCGPAVLRDTRNVFDIYRHALTS
eukprot:m.259967 g.259967  ORF g.259967 m.259967 type:complete len:335 (+) comp23099_c0_seq1:39-1043(+)